MKYGGKVMKKNQNRIIRKVFLLWVIFGLINFSWIPFNRALIPTFATLIPLIIMSVIIKKKKFPMRKKQDKDIEVSELERNLKKQHPTKDSNQEKVSTYRLESIIKDKKTPQTKQKSIINEGYIRSKSKNRY